MSLKLIKEQIQDLDNITPSEKEEFNKIVDSCYNLSVDEMKYTDEIISVPTRRLKFIKDDENSFVMFLTESKLTVAFGYYDYIEAHRVVTNNWFITKGRHYVLKPLISTRYNDLKERYAKAAKDVW